MTDAELEWLRGEFDRCREWIQAALDRDIIGSHLIDDVWEAIESGAAQLWPCPAGAVVTRIDEFPRLKALVLWLAGGRLADIVETEAAIQDWARRQGCDMIMIAGRRGWARVFPDCAIAHTVMVRRL